MRGKRPRGFGCLPLRRITPADAGKTHVDGGENLYRYKSPPRMRGKLRVDFYFSAPARITPADAGKTTECHVVIYGTKDHPRGCGENLSSVRQFAKRGGSPPRMRGKPPSVTSVYLPPGITPADAGKTLYWLSRWAVCRDHPRGCGENCA